MLIVTFSEAAPLPFAIRNCQKLYFVEICIGNKDIVYDGSTKEEFQPFFSVSMVLSALQMRRDGVVKEIG